jgi:hypothetical protein
MSSTEKSAADPATTKLLDKFWNQQLLPAAQSLHGRGVRFFETAPDPASTSYYTPHKSAADPFVQLEPADWERLLRDMWQKEGLPELTTLAGPLMDLAEKLKLRDAEQSDVSPFIYVMF